MLDESILIEPSIVGQILSKDQSHSMPSVVEDEIQAMRSANKSYFCPVPEGHKGKVIHSNTIHEFGDFRNGERIPQNHDRRSSEGGACIPLYLAQAQESSTAHKNYPKNSNSGTNLTSDWVARLPEFGRRARSYTEPMATPNYLLTEQQNKSPYKAKTQPVNLQELSRSTNSVRNTSIMGSNSAIPVITVEPPVHPPLALTSTPKRTSTQSSPMASPSDVKSASIACPSPISVMTPESKVIKVYMNKVQEGKYVI